MLREFEEEAGITGVEFEEFARLHGGNYRIHFFRGCDDAVSKVETTTDEEVRIYSLPLPSQVVPNLTWLIPLALDGALKTPILLFDADTYG